MKAKNQFISVLFIFCLLISISPKLINPIIPGYHPDPSIVRVEDDYYIVNSSFQYFPGVPILHSTDLINWEHIGNILDRESQLPLQGTSSWTGIYAPTIRYNNGVYYMITTNVRDNGGNFMVTAENPKGPWSEPIKLEQGGIDPSLYFEEGKTYMVSNPENTITLCEIDPKNGKQTSPSRAIWKGTGGRYPEGPHIYKKDGYYYLLISEGGTELAHKLTIARSKDIYGPYESNPNNPILTNCNMKGQSSSIQGTGHGDFVQAKDGSWWIVFLAFRFFAGSYHHMGRETFLAPVEWNKGEWPIVNGGNAINIEMDVDTPGEKKQKIERKSEINEKSPEWLYIQNPNKDNYKFEDGKLIMTASEKTLTENDVPSFLGRRQESPSFSVETEIIFENLSNGVKAGLTLYQIHDGHFDLFIRKNDDSLEVGFGHIIKSLVGEKSVKIDNETEKIKLKISSDASNFFFEYSIDDGETYENFDKQEVSLLSTEVVGGFTGLTIGMFAEGEGDVKFEYFDYIEKEESSE